MRRRRLTILDDISLDRLDQDSARRSEGGPVSISEWLQVLRSFLRMTQRELAKRAKITQPHLAEIESGKRDPRWSTLKRIFAALSCELYIDPRPKKSMKEILRGRARKLALKRLKQSMGSMALEGQAPDREIFLKLLEKRTDEILADRSQRLWQDKND